MPELPIFTLSVVRAGTRARVVLEGELDMQTAPKLAAALESLIAEMDVEVVVDLRALTFMDSTGLQALLQGHQEAQRTSRSFSLIRGTQTVMRVFELSGVDEVIPFADPVEID